MALWDAGTPLQDKRDIVEALLSADRPQVFQPKAPAHQTDVLQDEQPTLKDFVGP